MRPHSVIMASWFFDSPGCHRSPLILLAPVLSERTLSSIRPHGISMAHFFNEVKWFHNGPLAPSGPVVSQWPLDSKWQNCATVTLWFYLAPLCNFGHGVP